MVPIDMSMEARMVLAKMSFIYEREGGDRVKITRDEDIVRLINYAVDSLNKELTKYLENFCKLCTASELKELVAQGANIYRGALVPEETTPAVEVTQPTTVMYRGVAVPGPHSQEGTPVPQTRTFMSQKAEKPVEEKPAKPKRVYRGRVIEE